MATFQMYNVGKDELRDFQTSGDYEWMVMKSGSFDPDHDTVSDLVPGTNELSVGAYSRQAVDTPTRTVDNATDSVKYEIGDNPDFGDLTSGPETATALVLIKVVTNDSDSLPIAYGEFDDPIDTADLNPFVPHVVGLLIAETS